MVHTTINADEALRAAELRMARLRNLTPAMQVIGVRVVRDAQINFRSGGKYPVQWQKSRRAQVKGGQTLVQSAVLRNSIHSEAGAASVRIGSPVIYAAIHQYGRVVRPKRGKFLAFKGLDGTLVRLRAVRIPARPFLPVNAFGKLSPETTGYVERVLRRYITDGQTA